MNAVPTEHLHFGGCDTVALAQRFGTPLYVMDVDAIEKRMHAYLTEGRKWSAGFHASFACKAFCCKAICRLAQKAGFGLDVVSGGELFTALSAGVSPSMLTLHGNNKGEDEVDLALQSGVGRIVCDGWDDLELLESRCAALQKPARVLLRVNPIVNVATHAYVQTAHAASKFGFSLLGDSLRRAFEKLRSHPHLDLQGLHVHVGSQLMGPESHLESVRRCFEFLAEQRDRTGFLAREFNIGGGLGASYTENDNPQSIEGFVAEILAYIEKMCLHHSLPKPKILMEPGRSLVAEAGITLYTVGSVKEEVPGHRFVAIDGGMSDNPRPALYGARHRAVIANRALEISTETVNLAGKACESGDVLIRNLALPSPRRGDIVAVFTTGAYNFSMASNYNRHCRPAVVFVSGGKAEVAVRRETYEDLVERDLIPDSLQEAPRK